jgi:ankyrin repeat protein
MRSTSRILRFLPGLAGMLLHGTTFAAVNDTSAIDAGAAMTGLHQAAHDDDMTAIRRRIEVGDAVDARDDPGMTPLHHAALMGHINAVGLLLDHGADPNARATGDMTPLHFAAMLAHPEMAGLLVRRGARTDIRNASGMMPLHLAANEKVVNVLVLAGWLFFRRR